MGFFLARDFWPAAAGVTRNSGGRLKQAQDQMFLSWIIEGYAESIQPGWDCPASLQND